MKFTQKALCLRGEGAADALEREGAGGVFLGRGNVRRERTSCPLQP